jgi:hypothetical protein
MCENLIVFPETLKEATVEMNLDLLPQCNGEQAGIILYIDSDNYVRFIREMVADKHVVVLAKEIEGEPSAELITPFESLATKLHLTIGTDSIVVTWGSDSDDVQTKEFDTWFAPDAEFRVGLLVHGNNPHNQATFRSLSVNGVDV